MVSSLLSCFHDHWKPTLWLDLETPVSNTSWNNQLLKLITAYTDMLILSWKSCASLSNRVAMVPWLIDWNYRDTCRICRPLFLSHYLFLMIKNGRKTLIHDFKMRLHWSTEGNSTVDWFCSITASMQNHSHPCRNDTCQRPYSVVSIETEWIWTTVAMITGKLLKGSSCQSKAPYVEVWATHRRYQSFRHQIFWHFLF